LDRGHSRLYPFDPDSGRLPEIAAPGALLTGAGGGVVTLIVAPNVIQSSWSPAAAVAVARAWSDQGHRVVLFDLSLTDPVLHITLGLPNAVGIVDLVLREASIPSVAQQVGTPAFQFVSVGMPVEDPTEVTLSDEWSTFVEEVGSAQATVLFYLPADLPGVDALVAGSSATLLLAGDATEAEWVAQSFALDDVVGLVADRDGETAPIGDAAPAGDVAPTVDLAPTDGSPAVAPPSGTEVSEPEPEVQPEPKTQPELRIEPQLDPQPEPEPEEKLALWRPALVGTLVALGALFLWKTMVAPPSPAPTVGPAQSLPPTVSAAPSPPEPQQAYSLALAAYQAGEVAGRQARSMAQRRPDLLFIVAPVRVAGRVYHRVLAGPAADSLGAERLRASLAETLPGEDGARWIVRATPLAFDFGEFESTEAAEARIAEIGNAGIGAYVFEGLDSQGSRFRVYVGAYQSPAEAEVMREVLDAAFGDVPTLGPRIGQYVR